MFMSLANFLVAIIVVTVGLGLLILAPFIGVLVTVILAVLFVYAGLQADRKDRSG